MGNAVDTVISCADREDENGPRKAGEKPGTSSRNMCGWNDQNDLLKPKRKSLNFAYAFHQGTVIEQLDMQVDALFLMFDKDKSGTIDNDEEMEGMLTHLMQMHFCFGPRIVKRKKTNRLELVQSDDSEHSEYEDKGPKEVRRIIMKTFNEALGEANVLDGIDIEEFRLWMRKIVISRKRNLRILLCMSEYVQDILDFCFADADKDSSGTIGANEMLDFLTNVAEALGEARPDRERVYRVMERAGASESGEISYDGFQLVALEILTRVYYTHFNNSMNSHQKHLKPPTPEPSDDEGTLKLEKKKTRALKAQKKQLEAEKIAKQRPAEELSAVDSAAAEAMIHIQQKKELRRMQDEADEAQNIEDMKVVENRKSYASWTETGTTNVEFDPDSPSTVSSTP